MAFRPFLAAAIVLSGCATPQAELPDTTGLSADKVALVAMGPRPDNASAFLLNSIHQLPAGGTMGPFSDGTLGGFDRFEPHYSAKLLPGEYDVSVTIVPSNSKFQPSQRQQRIYVRAGRAYLFTGKAITYPADEGATTSLVEEPLIDAQAVDPVAPQLAPRGSRHDSARLFVVNKLSHPVKIEVLSGKGLDSSARPLSTSADEWYQASEGDILVASEEGHRIGAWVFRGGMTSLIELRDADRR